MALTIELGPDGLGNARLAADAVWETVASLHVLRFPSEHLLHSRLRRLVPSRPGFDLGLLMSLLEDPLWYPDLLGPTPRPDPPAPLVQIAALTSAPPHVLASDLTTLRQRVPGSPATRFGPTEYAERVSDALAGYWSVVLRPLWERVEAVTRDDLSHHGRLMVRDGVTAAVAQLHDRISYADTRLTVALPRTHRTVAPHEGTVWLVPSVFRWPWVATQLASDATVVSYAARGAARVWEPAPPAGDPAALGSLLGRSRAAILQSLDAPRSTTWLARHLRLSPGTVSEHLSVLTRAGLLRSTREGRSVHYFWTDLGCELVEGGPRAWSRRDLSG